MVVLVAVLVMDVRLLAALPTVAHPMLIHSLEPLEERTKGTAYTRFVDLVVVGTFSTLVPLNTVLMHLNSFEVYS